jgi:hypothetical protein
MSANPGISGSNVSQKATPPENLYRQAIVQCDGYRCLAYIDHDAVWRNYSDSKAIRGKVVVLEWLS